MHDRQNELYKVAEAELHCWIFVMLLGIMFLVVTSCVTVLPDPKRTNLTFGNCVKAFNNEICNHKKGSKQTNSQLEQEIKGHCTNDTHIWILTMTALQLLKLIVSGVELLYVSSIVNCPSLNFINKRKKRLFCVNCITYFTVNPLLAALINYGVLMVLDYPLGKMGYCQRLSGQFNQNICVVIIFITVGVFQEVYYLICLAIGIMLSI